MPISLTCEACGHVHNLPDYLQGLTVPCPCGMTLSVPKASSPPPPSGDATIDLGAPPQPQGEATIDLRRPPAGDATIDLGRAPAPPTPRAEIPIKPPAAPPAPAAPSALDETNAPQPTPPAPQLPPGLTPQATPPTIKVNRLRPDAGGELEAPSDDVQPAFVMTPDDSAPSDDGLGAASEDVEPAFVLTPEATPPTLKVNRLQPEADGAPLAAQEAPPGAATPANEVEPQATPPAEPPALAPPLAEDSPLALQMPTPMNIEALSAASLAEDSPPTLKAPTPFDADALAPDALAAGGAGPADPTLPEPGGEQPPAHAQLRSLDDSLPPGSGAGAGDETAFAPDSANLTPEGQDIVAFLRSPAAVERSRAKEYYDRGQAIARGGMGEIFTAQDRYLKRQVVMKLMLPGAQQDPIRMHRFVEEAQVTGQLEHPNIVPVHDLGVTEEGHLYFTMKLVKGEALDAVIKEIKRGNPRYNQYTVVHRLGVFKSICNALAFAHARGVTHRDLKPENVMIGEFGEVLVMDWGLAKVGTAAVGDQVESARSKSTEEIAKTMAGQVFGTPKYMAPEQARGDNEIVDALSDIYSLGAILYELLALRQAFTADSIFELMIMVGEGRFEPPGDVPGDPEVPVELRAIVLKAMANRRANRYQSVQALVADLDAYLNGFAVSAHQDSPWAAAVKWAKRNKSATAAIAAGLLAMVLAVVALTSYQRAQREKRVVAMIEAADALQKGAIGDGPIPAGYENQPARKMLTDAQGLAYQALGLDPDYEGIPFTINRTTTALSELDAEERRIAQIEDLRKLVDDDLKSARALPEPEDAESRRTWYAAWNRLLNTARGLEQEAEAKELVAYAQEQVIEAAKTLAIQLRKDGNYIIAATMIDEAARAGLDRTLVDVERLNLAQARTEHVRADQRAALKLFEQLHKEAPTDAEYQRMLAALSSMPRAHVAELLISRVGASDPWISRLAVEGLAVMGFPALKATISNYNSIRHDISRWNRDGEDELVQSSLKAVARRLHKKLVGDEEIERADRQSVELSGTTVDALSLALMRTKQPDIRARVMRALARMGTPQAIEVLALGMWQSGYGSISWRQGRRLLETLEPPPPPTGDDGEAWYRRGLVLHAMGKPKLALEAYAKTRMDDAGGLRALAYAHVERKRWPDAERQARAALAKARSATGRARSELLLARVLTAKGQAAEALPIAEQAAKANVLKGSEPWTVVGEIRRAAGDAEGARAALDTAINMGLYGAAAHFARAQLLIASGKPREALIDLDAAAALEPEEPEYLLARGRLFAELGILARALDDLDIAERMRPDDWRVFEARALARLNASDKQAGTKRATQAARDLDRAIALNPDAPMARRHRGRARYARRDYGGAIKDFTAVLKSAPGEVEIRQLRADAAHKYGDFDSALADLDAIIAAQPKNRGARLLRGIIRRGKQQFDESAADFGVLLEVEPEASDILFERGRTRFRHAFYPLRDARSELEVLGKVIPQARQQGGAQAAAPYEQRAQELNAALPGLQQAFKEKMALAIADMTAAIASDGKNPSYYYYRAQFHRYAENQEAANADLWKSVETSDKAWRERSIALQQLAGFYLQRAQQRGQNDPQGALADFKQGRKAVALGAELVKGGFRKQQEQQLKQIDQIIQQLGG